MATEQEVQEALLEAKLAVVTRLKSRVENGSTSDTPVSHVAYALAVLNGLDVGGPPPEQDNGDVTVRFGRPLRSY